MTTGQIAHLHALTLRIAFGVGDGYTYCPRGVLARLAAFDCTVEVVLAG